MSFYKQTKQKRLDLNQPMARCQGFEPWDGGFSPRQRLSRTQLSASQPTPQIENIEGKKASLMPRVKNSLYVIVFCPIFQIYRKE